jgi:hypothetical protein
MNNAYDPEFEADRLRKMAQEHEDIAKRYREAASIIAGMRSGPNPRSSSEDQAGVGRNGTTFRPTATIKVRSVWAQRIIDVLHGSSKPMKPAQIADALAEIGSNRNLDDGEMERGVLVSSIRNALMRKKEFFVENEGGAWSLRKEAQDSK